MLRVIIGMAAMAVLYAAFAVFYREKECPGNCGACGSGQACKNDRSEV